MKVVKSTLEILCKFWICQSVVFTAIDLFQSVFVKFKERESNPFLTNVPIL